MILSLGLGEPSYIPDAMAGIPHDEVELDLVAFCQCYAKDKVSWRLILLFARQPEWTTPEIIAAMVGEPVARVLQELGRLADLKLLEEQILVTGPLYRLTPRRALRRAVLRLREADDSETEGMRQ